MTNLQKRNQYIGDLCDMIEEYQALIKIWPGYINGPADVDLEGGFV